MVVSNCCRWQRYKFSIGIWRIFWNWICYQSELAFFLMFKIWHLDKRLCWYNTNRFNFFGTLELNSMLKLSIINYKISVHYIQSIYFIKVDHKTHHLDFDCNHWYDGSRHGNNYILIYISIRNMRASILICSLFQNIRLDRLKYEVTKKICICFFFTIITCIQNICMSINNFFGRNKQYLRIHFPSS